MSLFQRLFAWIMPVATFQKMKEESQHWFILCPSCGFKKSVWDMGGIRYKAKSIGKVRRLFCPQCREKRWFKWVKI